MANTYNINNSKDTFLFFNPLNKNYNLLNNFPIITYRGIILPRIPLDSNKNEKIIQFIYSPIEDMYYNNKDKENAIELEKINLDKSIDTHNSKDSNQFIYNNISNVNSSPELQKKSDLKKFNNFINNMDYSSLFNENKNLELIPPQNIISIINDDKNNDKNKISDRNNIQNINNIIVNNINFLSNNHKLNNKSTIINHICNQTIFNFNFNLYTNNTFMNNSENFSNFTKTNISKPIFAICYKPDDINEEEKNSKKRGRKSLSTNKNYRIHGPSDDDNLLRKIQVHFLSFVVGFTNDVIRTLIAEKNPPLFKNLDYSIKKVVNRKNVETLKKKNISEILQLRVSPKMKIHDESVNKKIYYKVCSICPFMFDYFQRSYLSLFREYFYNKNKIFIVNGRIIQLSIKTKTFNDLIIKNYKYKDKLKYIANRFFLN